MTDKLKEGMKYDQDKLRMELLPPEFEEAVAAILTGGAKKYEDFNWAKGLKYSRVIGALRRHLSAYLRGEKYDKESGHNHLWHAACNLAFLIYFDEHPEKYKEFNDLYAYRQEDKKVDNDKHGQDNNRQQSVSSTTPSWTITSYRCSRTNPCEFDIPRTGCTFLPNCPYKTPSGSLYIKRKDQEG